MEANNWTNDILNSSNGITKVTPDALLFSKIQNRISIQNTVSSQWIWIAAASFTILLSLNICILFSNTLENVSNKETIISQVDNNNQLY